MRRMRDREWRRERYQKWREKWHQNWRQNWHTIRTASILIVVGVGLVALANGFRHRWSQDPLAPAAATGAGGSPNAALMKKSPAGSKHAPLKAAQSPKESRAVASEPAAVQTPSSGWFGRMVSATKAKIFKTPAESFPAQVASAVSPGGKTSKAPSLPVEVVGKMDTAELLPSKQLEEEALGGEQAFSPKEYGTTGGGENCSAAEFRGPGIKEAGVTAEEWKKQMKEFHAAKRDLIDWLKSYASGLPPTLAQAMETQIRELRIQRPPTSENPDLGWRGIGVLMRDSNGELILRLGGGFPKLTEKAPERARFELIRLLAQSWAPCELARLGQNVGKEAQKAAVWKSLLDCFGVEESQACGDASYSEAGWAVSTAVAAVVAPPKCRLPVLRSSKYQACLSPLRAARAPAAGGEQ